ncbi:LysR substrate-binding domain-containing protein [Mesorhizobium sp. B2-8-5]|uniref:LysR substrate-binding domain-containing protein n=1 Tax=Mesorhizobium sp. B2-8-5 TaxID=2589903 RepID=UPI0011266577|nr:LysR substrate-binding domain-containing protein [Mesorhizobium sp. B2-8-5]UCI23731.1 LysR family transcriptional regulator [Mesorhizobium sp. B2-8-5]
MLKRTHSLPSSDILQELESSLLRSLQAVADTGSFVGAAQVMHRTPSAISMQMKKLERQMGQRIFAPKGRSIVLTPTGEALLTYARRITGIAEEVMQRFNRLSDDSKVRLGIPHDYAAAFLPSMLKGLAVACPQVEIDVTCRVSNALVPMLDSGELDVAVVTAGIADGLALTDSGIYHDRLAWAGLPDGLAHRQRPLPIAIAPLTCPWRRAAINALDRARISYRVVHTSNSFAGQIASILTGEAISPLPLVTLPPGIVPFGLEYGLPPIGSCSLDLRRSPHALSELVSTVADHIRTYFDLASRSARISADHNHQS